MTVESNSAIAIAKLSDWLKHVGPIFRPMRSKAKTFPRFVQVKSNSK